MEPRRVYDITLTIAPELTRYGGDNPPKVKHTVMQREHFTAQVTDIEMRVHTGTHVDAPVHFVPGGGDVASLPLSALIGRSVVLEVPDEVEAITAEFLDERADKLAGHSRLLFKTKCSQWWDDPAHEFRKDYVYLDASGAEWLVAHGFALVAMDYLSVDSWEDAELPAHVILLGAGVVAVEAVNLRAVPPGEYELICLPLKIAGSDGAPCRAVLREL